MRVVIVVRFELAAVISVAKLANLPDEVLEKAQTFSLRFEMEAVQKSHVLAMVKEEQLSELEELWESMQGST